MRSVDLGRYLKNLPGVRTRADALSAHLAHDQIHDEVREGRRASDVKPLIGGLKRETLEQIQKDHDPLDHTHGF